MELSTITVLKDQDPIAWDIAKSEYMYDLVENKEIMTFNNGSSYYSVCDIESFIINNLKLEKA